MLDISPHLLFELRQRTYAIPTALVQEIFPLPEVEPIPEAPRDILGVINYRGGVLPLMHLGFRLGQTQLRCRLSDTVIVLESQGIRIGLVVDRVKDTVPIPPSALEAEPDYGHLSEIHTAFVAGVAKLESGVVVLLNPETLQREPEAVEALASETDAETIRGTGDFYSVYCPEATLAEQARFQQRARELSESLEEAETDVTEAYAIFRLGTERFAIAANWVREFIRVPSLTPIPCCPPHILGNANLRGEVLTLIDLRSTLNLSTTPKSAPQAVVVEVADLVAGIVADEVLDIQYLALSELSPTPLVLPAGAEDYLQGVASYTGNPVAVLDLPKLFEQGDLIVEQRV